MLYIDFSLFFPLILPAGHCVDAYPSYGIAVVTAGLLNLSQFEDVEQIRHVTRTNMWVHEEFDDNFSAHDIGLIVFQTPFTYNFYVNAIELPSSNELHTGVATLNGWGSVTNSFYPDFPTVLQTVNMPIVSIETCRNNWGLEPDVLHDNHICAGTLQSGVSACDLDRGGGLTQNGEVVGVASFNFFPCAEPDIPSVFVRVSAYIQWIEDIIENNS